MTLLADPPRPTHTVDVQGFLPTLFEQFDELNFAEILDAPHVNKGSSGQPLFGYDGPNLTKAAMHCHALARRGEYAKALEFLNPMRVSLEIEQLALNYLRLLLPRPLWQRFEKPMPDSERSPVAQLVLRLYETFTGQSVKQIETCLAVQAAQSQANWNRCVPDEDHPTLEQLSRYYNSVPFPAGDLLIDITESHLSAAYRFMPIAVGQTVKAQRAFDYGGGCGATTSAMAGAGLRDVTLIESRQAALDFARWRDQHCHITNVRYLREHDVIADLSAHRGQHDFGVCTEVLEHVLDVHGVIQRLADLLKPGGFLFMSASFGLYPHLSHLKPNVPYSGREDELFAAVGLAPVQMNLPIPMLNNTRLYRKNG